MNEEQNTQAQQLLQRLHDDGWMVVCHNDYAQGGRLYHWWSFSRGSEFVKGEGPDDASALSECMLAVGRLQTKTLSGIVSEVQQLVDELVDLRSKLANAYVENNSLKGQLEARDAVDEMNAVSATMAGEQATHGATGLVTVTKKHLKELENKIEVRPVVRWFAEQMEMKLRANDHKGGWDNDQPENLYYRIVDESDELHAVLNVEDENEAPVPPDPKRVISEATDIANLAMMVADHFRDGGPSKDSGRDANIDSLIEAPSLGSPLEGARWWYSPDNPASTYQQLLAWFDRLAGAGSGQAIWAAQHLRDAIRIETSK